MEDISQRALKTFQEVDSILCEDTRITGKLLARYDIDKKLISYHHHSKLDKVDKILSLLKEGQDLALVSDAGTPAISDPGGELVSRVIQEISTIDIIPIPGPSAVISALSVAGIMASKYTFLGFPPHKKGRQKFLKEIANIPYPVIVYESKYRILKLLEELKEGNREVIVFREITKLHETIYRGDIQKTIDKLTNDQERKGEFVVIIK
jgi:16S rRNA (cytidine1402-2'-O)-methyltransferase